MTIAVTGANSSVGLNLLAHLVGDDFGVIAGVRSERAATALPASPSIAPRIASYEDIDGWSEALRGASCVVHLAGILIEWPGTSYESANEGTAAAVAEAARRAGVQHMVLVSVIGADVASPNRYLRSKGEAERVVMDSGISSTVVRTPILLGPGTAGAASIARSIGQGKAKLLGGGRYSMRPLDVDDLSRAIVGICRSLPQGTAVHELVGPESITYRELLARAADVAGKELSFGVTPIWLAKLGAAVMSRVKGGGISPTVIDVITADEVVEKNADEALGIRLTPLSETLQKILP
ncbi:MAG: NAD(P)H-binding protein [Gemmatimonadota bacterium]|nr:NAD(P)H-binding protein [Gemmatimonadota bacterium]MDH3421622.1 NAD(P)H-binding protein [Gemmatimonadota bacterium]